MTTCINCGQESKTCLCERCKQTVDMEILCERLAAYRPGIGENELWDRLAGELISPHHFRNVIFAISDELVSPRKEYYRILCMGGNSGSVNKSSRAWLYETYRICKEQEGLSVYERNRVKGMVVDALYKDYYFAEADKLAGELLAEEELSIQVYLTLGDFYTKTRRYDSADKILFKAQRSFADDERALYGIQKLLEENQKQREKKEKGKTEYMPNPKENKQEVREKYVAFLASLGIKAEVPVEKEKGPVPISKDQYPDPVETRDADFDSFVVFDLETTGRNTTIDSMIEIGAIKVKDGKIIESKEFVFQEYVKPFKKRVSAEVEKLTGISQADVQEAREMWEVFPDFMKFVGDDVLVGFNCVRFDSRFLMRAGRYSHLLIENKYFDVMRYAEDFREQLGIEEKGIKLETLSEKLGVDNPNAHRALADAITTAKVFLKLKEMSSNEETTLEDLLADLDDW